MVRRKRLRFRFRILRVIGNPGGANEAVIRMLISIGRCVWLILVPDPFL
jgi:hypothetical protein